MTLANHRRAAIDRRPCFAVHMSPFPLPLTNFEQFLYWDDSPGYPHAIAGRFRFDGQLNEQAAIDAIDILSRRHPLLSSTVERRGRKLVWQYRPNDNHLLGIFQSDGSDEFPDLPRIDLDQDIAGKIAYVVGPDSCDVILHGHHACCDGVAALQVISDWMSIYSQLITDPTSEPKLRKLDAQSLAARGNFGFASWSYLKKLPKQALGLYGVKEFLTNPVVPIVPDASPDPASPPPAPYPRAITLQLCPEESSRHLDAAKQLKVTPNELMLAGLLRAIRSYRQERGFGAADDWLRIMVPINMREFRHRSLPAANRVSLVSVDRRAHALDQLAEVAQSIKGQMDVIHHYELNLTFQAMLGFFQWFPGSLRRLASRQRCTATCILTNLGEPFRRSKLRRPDGKLQAGNLVLQSIDLVGPLRPQTNAAIAAYRYAGRQCFTATYDPRLISRDDATELLAGLTREIHNDDRQAAD